ncbi:Laminin subunit beta-1 [Gryllus bimaculatus]|nr:Laminin subunit beta-1 [Gryllus bimaculatus]
MKTPYTDMTVRPLRESRGLNECLHNTTGKHCEFCIEGFFSNATRGLPTDCKLCACPSEDPTHSFSPTCTATPGGGHMCTSCARGHAGPHCERCEPGYFGNPAEPGGACKPCACGGGPCDSLTGRCLKCPGNTEGWRCERCLPAHYGDPAAAACLPCDCHPAGSVTVKSCDLETGQCQCRPQFSGRMCNQCKPGYGNISAGCPPCSCDSVGAATKVCDPDTGQCSCQPGVTGVHCNLCQPQHFGFSSTGCEGKYIFIYTIFEHLFYRYIAPSACSLRTDDNLARWV